MSSKTRKARKEHSCVICHTSISPGTRYIYQRITPWDHPMNEYYFDYKAHKECDKKWMECGSYHRDILPDSFGMWMDCFMGYYDLRIEAPDHENFEPSTSYEKMLAWEALK